MQGSTIGKENNLRVVIITFDHIKLLTVFHTYILYAGPIRITKARSTSNTYWFFFTVFGVSATGFPMFK